MMDQDQMHAADKQKHQHLPDYRVIQGKELKFDKENGTKILLGAGSFGAVYRGTYEALGQTKVAIKQVKGSEYGGLSDRDKRDFLKEARTMYILRHQDIVTIYGAVCDSEIHIYGLVMEYMERGSMDALLEKVEVPWPVKVCMLLSVARGLTFLHTPQENRPYPVIHADIKASNIFINSKFQAKIGDFGEAILQGITSRSITRKTRDKAGTVTHMSPELLNPPADSPNFDPTEKSDVWSFGITIFEICAENAKGTAERRTPFPKKMRDGQIIWVIGMSMVSPFNTEQMKKVEGCDCPQYLIDIMQKCCIIDTTKRPNFKVVTSELEKYYSRECQPEINSSLTKLRLNYEGQQYIPLPPADPLIPEGAVGGLSADPQSSVHRPVSQKKGHQVTPLPTADPHIPDGAPGDPKHAYPLEGGLQAQPSIQQLTNEIIKVQKGMKVLSDQIFVQGKASTQQIKNDLALKSDDASSIHINFQHPVLRKHQADLEEHMKPSDSLLDSLITSQVIAVKDKQIIKRDIGDAGKVKRIFVLVNAAGEIGPESLIDALIESNNSGNEILAGYLKQTLNEYQQSKIV